MKSFSNEIEKFETSTLKSLEDIFYRSLISEVIERPDFAKWSLAELPDFTILIVRTWKFLGSVEFLFKQLKESNFRVEVLKNSLFFYAGFTVYFIIYM